MMTVYGVTDHRSIYHDGRRTTLGCMWRVSRAARIIVYRFIKAWNITP